MPYDKMAAPRFFWDRTKTNSLRQVWGGRETDANRTAPDTPGGWVETGGEERKGRAAVTSGPRVGSVQQHGARLRGGRKRRDFRFGVGPQREDRWQEGGGTMRGAESGGEGRLGRPFVRWGGRAGGAKLGPGLWKERLRGSGTPSVRAPRRHLPPEAAGSMGEGTGGKLPPGRMGFGFGFPRALGIGKPGRAPEWLRHHRGVRMGGSSGGGGRGRLGCPLRNGSVGNLRSRRWGGRPIFPGEREK